MAGYNLFWLSLKRPIGNTPYPRALRTQHFQPSSGLLLVGPLGSFTSFPKSRGAQWSEARGRAGPNTKVDSAPEGLGCMGIPWAWIVEVQSRSSLSCENTFVQGPDWIQSFSLLAEEASLLWPGPVLQVGLFVLRVST